jgi:hypothetical protein
MRPTCAGKDESRQCKYEKKKDTAENGFNG